jgi:biotin carboxylase
MATKPTILCISSYFKGNPFLEEAKRQGAHVILLTIDELKEEAWAREFVDEFFYLPVPGLSKQPDTTYAVSFLARTRAIDRIVPLDDFDVETAADLREHLRLAGMTASQARYYRDKLAMRVQAQAKGVPIPPFVHILNHERVHAYMETTPGPWVLKPRGEASAMGIRKIHDAGELWPRLEELGDRQSFFLLEQFIPGDVYHVDSVVWNGNVAFVASNKYGIPPMAVYHGGGVFATSSVPYDSAEDQALESINREVIHAMGLHRGVTHAEFIRSHADGRFYFLEMAARVGGAGIDQMVEFATGINLWREWARLEVAQARGVEYVPPAARQEFAGLLVSLARQEWPDTSAYNDPEIVWRLHKKNHVGMIVHSASHARIQELIGQYASRIAQDYTTSAPPLDHAPH